MEPDLGAEQFQAGAWQRVQRPDSRDRQQLMGGLGRTGLVLGVCARKSPPRAGAGLRGQLGCTLQERGRGGQAPAGTRPLGRALQPFSYLFLSSEHRLCAVPGTAIRGGLWVGCFGQRAVGAATV
ncbi:hypothetical protein ACFWC6_34015, partial [Micromonospora chalcea]